MAIILGGRYHAPEATRNAIKRDAKTTQYHHKRAWRYQIKIQQVVDNLIASAYKIGRSSILARGQMGRIQDLKHHGAATIPKQGTKLGSS